MLYLILLPSLGLLLGAFIAMFIARRTERRRVQDAQLHADTVLRQADLQREALIEDALADAADLRASAEDELRERRETERETEQRLNEKGKNLDRKSQTAANLKRRLDAFQREAEAIRQRLEAMDEIALTKLSEISGIPIEQARADVLEQATRTLRDDAQTRLREIEAQLQEEADVLAHRALSNTVQRLSSAVVSTSPGSSISLSERELKRITAGSEIIEQVADLAGVTLNLDEETAVLSISAPDAVKRELARLSLTDILKNGRRSPRDIETLVRKQERKLERSIRDAGIAAVRRAGVGRLPEDVIKMFGRLQYRYSYGQNQLIHAVETAHLAAMIAHELHADVDIARAGGLLHDLGKAIDREVEGTHAQLGAALALESGLDERIAHCIAAHHEEIEPATTEAHITIIADALSGARPGARRESLEGYLARLEALEAVANAFPGVDKCYAIQAGRELRVIVNAEDVDDPGAERLAKAISERIQETLEYPGQIAVLVIRETRAVEHTH